MVKRSLDINNTWLTTKGFIGKQRVVNNCGKINTEKEAELSNCI
jgi:hypothetical protein